MKLQEFLSETLKQIIAGVTGAQAYAKDHGAIVNPGQSGGEPREKYSRAGDVVAVTDIDFDVAVTSTDMSETQAGAGIFVAAFGMGVKDKSDTVNSCISRIRFPLRIVLPAQRT